MGALPEMARLAAMETCIDVIVLLTLSNTAAARMGTVVTLSAGAFARVVRGPWRWCVRACVNVACQPYPLQKKLVAV